MECVICTETKEDVHFPSSFITLKCEHLPNTCLPCIRASIKSELQNKIWKEIGCPECAAVLEYDDVQRLSDDETKEKYEELMLRFAIQQDSDFIWCSSGCGSGQLHDGGTDQPIVRCNSCNHLSCFQHKVSWHTGLTCEDYDEINISPEEYEARTKRENEENEARHTEENKASEEKIDETTKRCPECKARIEKNGGW
ncbi:E3 ubiquitin-protein ligase RNF19A-like protein [Cladobotryum mycophilum]|uniref:RBR-type E3 ubiquitin transferase n=1 Tax=Cladobotryum mycophilum TaxID=491253 RepID=A0ABR0SR35_9HYPO